MSDTPPGTESRIAELAFFEGEFVEFDVIDRETREPIDGIRPYVRAEDVPDDASRGDMFEIVYDVETEEIQSLHYSEEEDKKQTIHNAKRLAQLKDDEVVTTPDENSTDNTTE